MLVESKFTDTILNNIADYIACARITAEKLSYKKCLDALVEHTKFARKDIKAQFGDIIKEELLRANEQFKNESKMEFDSNFLKEDTAEDVHNEVQNQTNGKQVTQSDKTNRGNDFWGNKIKDTRLFFLYVNAANKQQFIVSVDASGKVSQAASKFATFAKNLVGLKTVKYMPGGIIVAPINANEAKNLIQDKKVPYKDLSPKAQPQQQQQQKQEQNTAEGNKNNNNSANGTNAS